MTEIEFAEFFEQNRGRLKAWARRTISEGYAEDAIHDAYIEIGEEWDEHREKTPQELMGVMLTEVRDCAVGVLRRFEKRPSKKATKKKAIEKNDPVVKGWDGPDDRVTGGAIYTDHLNTSLFDGPETDDYSEFIDSADTEEEGGERTNFKREVSTTDMEDMKRWRYQDEPSLMVKIDVGKAMSNIAEEDMALVTLSIGLGFGPDGKERQSMTVRQLAEETGNKKSTVQRHLKGALKRLGKHLEGYNGRASARATTAQRKKRS